MEKKYLGLLISALFLLILGVVPLVIMHTGEKEIEKPPQKIKEPRVQAIKEIKRSDYFLGRKKHKITPIVVKSPPTLIKPEDGAPEKDWQNYYREIFEKIRSNMSPEYAERLREIIRERVSQDQEEKMTKLDEKIDKLKKQIEEKPEDKESAERLQIYLRSKNRYQALKEIFLEK